MCLPIRIQFHTFRRQIGQISDQRQMRHLNCCPANLEEHNEYRVVGDLLQQRCRRAQNARVEYEWEAAHDQYRSDQMPNFSPPIAAEDIVFILVRSISNQWGGDGIHNLSQQNQQSRSGIIETQFEVEQGVREPNGCTQIIVNMTKTIEQLGTKTQFITELSVLGHFDCGHFDGADVTVGSTRFAHNVWRHDECWLVLAVLTMAVVKSK